MKQLKLHIKNMVCPRCILMVKDILNQLEIPYQEVQLGQINTSDQIDEHKLQSLDEKLNALGFELLEPGKSSLISKIKTAIIEQVHYTKEPITVNFSTLIADRLHHEYTYLSRLFSSVEGITIEKFIVLQKIEKVKEYLIYNQMTLSEIANEMNYSSVAHLSSQFKKETGMTPTQFKGQTSHHRKPLDRI